MKRLGACTLLASKNRGRNKEYIKWLVWLPRIVGDYFQKGTKFEVYVDGATVVLDASGKAELKAELYDSLLNLFIKAFKDPEIGVLLREKFPEDVGLILNILKKMKGGEE